jgi:hypothetical protein
MASLSDDRVRSFLLEGTRTGKVAWVASDGAPHVAPIWFVLDGDDVVFNTGAGTGKGRAFACGKGGRRWWSTTTRRRSRS